MVSDAAFLLPREQLVDFRKQLESSAPFAIGLLWVSFIAGPTFWLVLSAIKLSGIDSTVVASWVQAFGSIGAIIGAFAVANRQTRNQQLHLDQQKAGRLESMHAVVQIVADHARAMGEFAKDKPADYAFQNFWNIALGGSFQAVVQALKAMPVHELGKADLVVQCMAIIGAMTRMQTDIEHYLSETPSTERTLEIYAKVDVQVQIVDYSWRMFSKHAELSIASSGSC